MGVSFVFKDIEILNPFASENEFDAVSPAYYGFSIVETGGGFTAWGRDDEGGKTFVWITENDTAASMYSDAADVLICRYDTETGDTLECSTLADNMAELAAMCAPEESGTGAPPAGDDQPSMTLLEAVTISKAAKLRGYSVAVKAGRLQFQIVTYRKNGTSDVKPVTGWLTLNEARAIIDGE